jgi:hypothetical protein
VLEEPVRLLQEHAASLREPVARRGSALSGLSDRRAAGGDSGGRVRSNVAAQPRMHSALTELRGTHAQVGRLPA